MFFNSYVEDISTLMDCPREYVEASAYHNLSSIFSRFFHCTGITQLTRPNVMFIMSSIPGRTRRSTLLSADNAIYRAAYTAFLNKSRVIPCDKIEELIADSILEEGSPEGVMDDITEYRKNLMKYPPKKPYYDNIYNVDFQSSEFGDILGSMSKDGYQRGMARIISKIYNGEGSKISLSLRGPKKSRYLERGTYGTMFASMQTAGLYIDAYHVNQGLMRRLILINGKSNRHLPYWDMSREDVKSKTEPLVEILSKRLDTILEEYDKIREEGKMCSIPVYLSPKVETLVNELNEQREELVDEDPADYNNLVRQSDGEHVQKLATLHAIDELNFKGKLGLMVEEKHWNPAKEFFDRATAGNKEVYDRIGIKKVSAESHTEPIERIFRIIANKVVR